MMQNVSINNLQDGTEPFQQHHITPSSSTDGYVMVNMSHPGAFYEHHGATLDYPNSSMSGLYDHTIASTTPQNSNNNNMEISSSLFSDYHCSDPILSSESNLLAHYNSFPLMPQISRNHSMDSMESGLRRPLFSDHSVRRHSDVIPPISRPPVGQLRPETWMYLASNGNAQHIS